VERIKGAHTAIAVARRTGRKLIIAGNHAERGSELDYWMREIAPQLWNGIEYVGPVDDAQKNALLGRAAALIVPIEWNEPFGIVFAEALACGTPVISCPRGALPEIVRHGTDGFLVESLDQACEAVERVHTIDRAVCRERVKQLFSLPVIAAQYEQLYRERIARQ
jgi:glycosyltransferase involved in cell wall biosynthesis